MSAQIDKVCTTVQKKYGVLRKIRRFIGLDTAILIYKVMIRPHFDYGDYMIDSGTQCKIEKLERIQDRIIDSYRPDRTLRSCDKIKLKSNFTRITKIQKSPFYRGVSLWDSLPKELQKEQSRKTFKNIINQYKFD